MKPIPMERIEAQLECLEEAFKTIALYEDAYHEYGDEPCNITVIIADDAHNDEHVKRLIRWISNAAWGKSIGDMTYYIILDKTKPGERKTIRVSFRY